MTKTEQSAKMVEIEKEINKMKIGFCGQKFGCLVWRIAEHKFIVGKDSISLREESWHSTDAAHLIFNLSNH